MDEQSNFSFFFGFQDKYTKRLSCYHEGEGGMGGQREREWMRLLTGWRTQREGDGKTVIPALTHTQQPADCDRVNPNCEEVGKQQVTVDSTGHVSFFCREQGTFFSFLQIAAASHALFAFQ